MLEKLKKIPALFYVLPLILLAIAIASQYLPIADWVQQLDQWVKSLGVWGPVAFAVIYIVVTVALLPASLFSILAGLVFGWWGLPLVLVAATIGASLAFLIGRHLARSKVEKLAGDNPKLRAVDDAVSDEGWKVVFMMRLSPAVPFNLQNYFFGTTKVEFWPYVLATAVGIVPGAAVYVYLGTIGKLEGGGTFKWILLVVGLAVTVVLTWYLSRKAKQKLDQYGVEEKQKAESVALSKSN